VLAPYVRPGDLHRLPATAVPAAPEGTAA